MTTAVSCGVIRRQAARATASPCPPPKATTRGGPSIPELRPHTGRDPDVRDYVLGQEDAGEFLDRYTDVLRLLVPGYRREGKRYLTLAVGCTGGKHRSVAIAEEFARRLRELGIAAEARHRDLGRE